MKLTKTLTLAALVAGGLLAGSTALQAQDNTNTPPAGAPPANTHSIPPGIHRRNAEMIAKDLGLTDDQKAKVQAALEDRQQKMMGLRSDTSVAPQDKRAKAKEIQEAFTAKMKEILTPDQFAKWQKPMQPQMRPAAGSPPPGSSAPKN
jgi:Spy/CpxP family protein refolding chaperone